MSGEYYPTCPDCGSAARGRGYFGKPYCGLCQRSIPEVSTPSEDAGTGLREAVANAKEFIAAADSEGFDPNDALDLIREFAALTSETTPKAEVAIPAGMVAWKGGESAPEDWDGGDTLLRSGTTYPGDYHVSVSWEHDGCETDIIAYTPKPAAPVQAEVEREEVARRLLRTEVGDGEVGVSVTWGGNPSIPAHAALAAICKALATPRPSAPS